MLLHAIEPSFNGGEISPDLIYRQDQQKYTTWLAELENMFCKAQGGIYNRAGTYMLAKTKSDYVRIIPFEFNTDQTYMLEFGDRYIRFFTPDGQIVIERPLEENPEETEKVPYEITSPFASADLDKIRCYQTGDVMYIAWGGKPRKLSRLGHTQWVLEEFKTKNGPYELENTDENKHVVCLYYFNEEKYYISADSDLFVPEDVGRMIRYENRFPANHLTGVTGVTGVTDSYKSEVVLVKGDFTLNTSGTWSGIVHVEYSKDLHSFNTEHSFSSSADNHKNYNYSGRLADDYYWVRIAANITSGTLNFTLDTQEFKDYLQFEIARYVSGNKVEVESRNNIPNLHTIINKTSGGGDLKEDLVPDMTSNTTPQGRAESPYFGENAYRFWAKNDPANIIHLLSFYTASVSYAFAQQMYINKVFFNAMIYAGWETLFPANAGHFSAINVFATKDNVRKKLESSFVTEAISGSLYARVVISIEPTVVDKIELEISIGNILNYRIYFKGGGASGYALGDESLFLNYRYSLGLWGDSVGYPTDVCFYQNRLCWAHSDRLDFSRIGRYEDYGVSAEVTDDDAVSVSLKDKEINQITALAVAKRMVVFTSGSNFVHSDNTLTPSTAIFTRDENTGSAFITPTIARGNVLYAQPMKEAVADFLYSLEADSYGGDDITLLAKHLFTGDKIKSMAYQHEPDSQLWVVLASGALLCCTYKREQNVVAWAHMKTAGKVLSVGALNNGPKMELFLAVQRGFGTFIERMPRRMESDDVKEQFFVDCGRTYRGAPVSEIAGLDYLEGKNVAVLADGYVESGRQVKDGKIVLEKAAGTVHVGLPYQAHCKTLPPVINLQDGSALNAKKRIVEVFGYFVKSRGGTCGIDGNTEYEIIQRTDETEGMPYGLFTGRHRATVTSAANCDQQIVLRQNDPLPFAVSGIGYTVSK